MWSDNLDLRHQKDKVKQKIRTRSGMKSRNQDKLKTKSVVDHSQNAKIETLGEILKRESVNDSSSRHEELVKHMSNLPGYLKRSDRGKNIQEKALNFGVLDWSRLEKWKKNNQSFNSFEDSSSSSRVATTSSSTFVRHKKFDDKKGLCSSENVKQYRSSGKKIIERERKLRSREFESIGKIQLDKSHQKEKMSDYDVEVEAKSMKGLQHHGLKKNERSFNSGSDNRVPSLEQKDKGISFGFEKKTCSRSNERKDLDIDVDQKHCHSMPRDIVLLRPRKFLQSSFEDYFPLSQSIVSSDEIFSESSLSSSSYISLPGEAYTENSCYDTIHSSVLLPSATDLASSSSSSETTQDSFDTHLDVDLSSNQPKKTSCSDNMSSLKSKDTCIEKDFLDMKLRNQCSFGDRKESNESDKINLSQLSFGLNRLGRSLSFKEGPTLPKQTSKQISAKSGPLIFDSSSFLNNSSKDHKVNDHKRTRSSTFMRLLDPIWKHKASNIILTPKESPDSTSFQTNNLNDEKRKESPVKAVLQLTINNGLPLFHFVINAERMVLAAAMNSFASPEKDDGSCYFTFYLLNEVKKKSGRWMSHHWNKEKNCGYAYNVAGHMKISSSKITQSKDKNFKGWCMVKDYVLFGIGIDQPDQGPQEFVKRKELAAAVIEIPYENVSSEGLHNGNLMKKECLKCLLAEKRCFCISQENDMSGSSITVILPGGLHASPNKGEPSPLIHRWKLGGLCDCGGWDVGCKLRVLSNQNPSSNPHLQRFQLFVQEGTEEDTPLFILEPLKDGFYSVEFSSTITHLQAFFISVSFLSSKKLPNSLDMSKKLSSKEKATKNYNSVPPLSPVDRV